jgi:hypothetical protein
MKDLEYDNIDVQSEAFKIFLINVEQGIVTFLFAFTDVTEAYFDNFDQVISSIESLLATYYFMAKISVTGIVIPLLALFWLRRISIGNYLDVYYGFKKQDCEKLLSQITEVIEQQIYKIEQEDEEMLLFAEF